MSRVDEFRALHEAGEPLVLPNAWDYASGAALAAAGHVAVGTTSLGVAAAAGKPDAGAATRDETVALARSLGRLPVLVTVDIEGGFSDDPADVAELAAELAEAGAVGVNLEDGRADGTLTDPDRHAAKVAAVKARVPELFVNARTDPFWLPDAGGPDPLTAALERLAAYRAAGADGAFVPGAADADAVAALVGAGLPLNVLFLPGRHTVPELAALGVARVSTGSLLFRAALAAAVRAAGAVRAGRTPDTAGLPSYAEVQRLTG
jgi:2-methylisocitrate lyase-like PEP mutase family enzyme